MLVYWLLFAYFAAGVAFQRKAPTSSSSTRAQNFLLLGAVLVAVLVGLRYEVGGDWGGYERMFQFYGYASFDQAVLGSDPGYRLVNWFAQRLGAGVWLVNLVCAAIFTWGLFRLAKAQPDPWLAILVAVPYLIIVVAMGYTRQAVAIGILMAGLASLQAGGTAIRFAFYVAAAALFHRTAIVALPIAALGVQRNTLINVLASISAFVVLYDALVADSMDILLTNYVTAQYSSQGAVIRVVMSLVPACLFLFRKKAFGFSPEQAALWRNFSIAAFVFLVLLWTLPSSTVVDRLALYVLPLQIVILARIPGRLMSYASGRVAVVTYSFAVLFVWLNFAVNSLYWLPYKFYPLAAYAP